MEKDTSRRAGEGGTGGAAVKLQVKLTMRIARDGKVRTFVAAGRMHRLPTGSGWVLSSKLPDSSLLLIIRPDEIRMKRTGQISQEQRFRTGQWLAGTIGTAYGDLRAEAWTRRIKTDLTSGGGAVEWEYDLRTAELELGRTAVTLQIREEPSV